MIGLPFFTTAFLLFLGGDGVEHPGSFMEAVGPAGGGHERCGESRGGGAASSGKERVSERASCLRFCYPMSALASDNELT